MCGFAFCSEYVFLYYLFAFFFLCVVTGGYEINIISIYLYFDFLYFFVFEFSPRRSVLLCVGAFSDLLGLKLVIDLNLGIGCWLQRRMFLIKRYSVVLFLMASIFQLGISSSILETDLRENFTLPFFCYKLTYK